MELLMVQVLTDVQEQLTLVVEVEVEQGSQIHQVVAQADLV